MPLDERPDFVGSGDAAVTDGGAEASLSAPDTGAPDAGHPSPAECNQPPGEVDLQAQWSGWVVDRHFGPSRSPRIRLALPDSAHTLPDPDTGQPNGWVYFGDARRRSPPTSPDSCYLMCDAESESFRWHEGFVYPIQSYTKTETQIALEIRLYEPWRTWCEMQEPVARGDGSGSCAPAVSSCQAFGSTGLETPCCRDRLCNQLQVCDCDRTDCKAADETSTLQLSWSTPEILQGTLDGVQVVLLRPERPDAPDPSRVQDP